jgi:hypothetical protein
VRQQMLRSPNFWVMMVCKVAQLTMGFVFAAGQVGDGKPLRGFAEVTCLRSLLKTVGDVSALVLFYQVVQHKRETERFVRKMLQATSRAGGGGGSSIVPHAGGEVPNLSSGVKFLASPTGRQQLKADQPALKAQVEHAEEALDELLELADTDKDGVVDAVELAKLIHQPSLWKHCTLWFIAALLLGDFLWVGASFAKLADLQTNTRSVDLTSAFFTWLGAFGFLIQFVFISKNKVMIYRGVLATLNNAGGSASLGDVKVTELTTECKSPNLKLPDFKLQNLKHSQVKPPTRKPSIEPARLPES